MYYYVPLKHVTVKRSIVTLPFFEPLLHVLIASRSSSRKPDGIEAHEALQIGKGTQTWTIRVEVLTKPRRTCLLNCLAQNEA